MENRFVFMWAFAPRIFKNHVWDCLVLPIRLTISYGVRTSSGFLARVSIKAPHGSAVQEFVWVPESDVLLLASLGLIPSPLRHGSFLLLLVQFVFFLFLLLIFMGMIHYE